MSIGTRPGPSPWGGYVQGGSGQPGTSQAAGARHGAHGAQAAGAVPKAVQGGLSGQHTRKCRERKCRNRSAGRPESPARIENDLWHRLRRAQSLPHGVMGRLCAKGPRDDQGPSPDGPAQKIPASCVLPGRCGEAAGRRGEPAGPEFLGQTYMKSSRDFPSSLSRARLPSSG